MFETGVVQANGVDHSARSGCVIWILFSIFFNMKVCCIEAILMSANNIPFLMLKKENHPKLSQICSYGIFPRDSRTSSKQPW